MEVAVTSKEPPDKVSDNHPTRNSSKQTMRQGWRFVGKRPTKSYPEKKLAVERRKPKGTSQEYYRKRYENRKKSDGPFVRLLARLYRLFIGEKSSAKQINTEDNRVNEILRKNPELKEYNNKVQNLIKNKYPAAQFILEPSEDFSDGLQLNVRLANHKEDFGLNLLFLHSQVQDLYDYEVKYDVRADYGRMRS